MPALPLDEAGKYVAGAYVVFLALLLVYVAIMAARLQRIDRELAELAELAEQQRPGTGPGAADAGAVEDPRAVGEGKVFEREQSTRQEVFRG
jgi:hypothetical protein